MRYLIYVSLFAIAISNFYFDVQWGPWFTTQVILAVYFGYHFTQIHWTLGIASFWNLFSGIWVYGFWFNNYIKNPEMVVCSLHKLAAESVTTSSMSFFAFLNIKKKHWLHVRDGMVWICWLNGVYYLWEVYAGWTFKTHLQGFFGNTSQSACMAALAVPFLFKYRRWVCIVGITCVLAVAYVAQSSMAYLVLMAGLVTWCFLKLKRAHRFAFVPLAIIVVAVLGQLFDYQFWIFHKIDRFQFWGNVMSWLRARGEWGIGFGNGSAWVLGPAIQVQYGMPTDQGHWIWFHNDWLQVLFEQGLVGLLAVSSVVIVSFKRAIKLARLDLATVLVAYCVFAFGMYPTNIAFSALFGMMILRGIWYDGDMEPIEAFQAGGELGEPGAYQASAIARFRQVGRSFILNCYNLLWNARKARTNQ